MNKLSLYADPLGDLFVEWQIESAKYVEIDLPHYKYEMSNFIGIPVPFASIAEKIESSVFKITDTELPDAVVEYLVRDEFHGGKTLVINSEKERSLNIQYIIRSLVNRDKIYFSFVFSLISPVASTLKTAISVTARFSYDVNSYKFKTALIGKETGRIEGWPKILIHEREGDFIRGVGTDIILGDAYYDLHVHGSRLPLMVDRRIFWFLVFAIAIIGVSTLLSLLKIK